MKKAALLICLVLTACQPKEVVSMTNTSYATPLPEGFEGCEWEQVIVNVKPPLSGKLWFKHLKCPRIKNAPTYGYDRKFYMNSNNELLANAVPTPPGKPKMGKGKTPLIKLDTFSDTPETYMTNLLIGSQPNCGFSKNEKGFWSAGYDRAHRSDFHRAKITSEEPEYWDGRMPKPCTQLFDERFYVQRVARFNKGIVFLYDFDLIERSFYIDPGSVQLRR